MRVRILLSSQWFAIRLGVCYTNPMPYKSKEKQREFNRKWVAKRRAEFFKNKVCVQCGSKKDLELDHIKKEDKVSNRIWSWSKERRESEIKKCQILCHDPCHKEKTRQEYQKTHCLYGHEFNVTGRDISKGKMHNCSECRRIRDRKRSRKKFKGNSEVE